MPEALSRTSQASTVPVLLMAGVIVGIWHHRRSGRKVHITVEPFRKLAARHQRELAGQVERIAEILEAAADLTVGTVSVGHHLSTGSPPGLVDRARLAARRSMFA